MRKPAKVAAPDAAVYVYGVARGVVDAPVRPPRGVPGAGPAKALPAGAGLFLVAAEVPAEDYASGAIERGLRDLDWVSRCALGHEAVVEFFSRRATLAPAKLFTVFDSAERAAMDVQLRRPALLRVLRRIEGRDEWGIRVRVGRLPAPAGRRPAPSTGTAFLRHKQAARHAVRDALREARAKTSALLRRLGDAADATVEREPPAGPAGASLLLDAVFLVPRARAGAFRALADAESRACRREGLSFDLTGPWPPYHFSGARR